MSQIRIELPKACQQDFDVMPRTESGRYCALCERTIIDFTLLSDDEFIEYLSSHQFKISCGIFRRDQLNRSYALEKNRPFFRFPSINKWMAAFLLLPLHLPQGIAQTQKHSTHQIFNKAKRDTLIHLQGKLLTNDSTSGIAHIEIKLLDSNQLVLQTTQTDRSGKFAFDISADRMNDTVQLQAQAIPNFHVEPVSISLSYFVAYNPPVILTMMPSISLPAVNVITTLPRNVEPHVTGGVPIINYNVELIIPKSNYSILYKKKKKHHKKKKSK